MPTEEALPNLPMGLSEDADNSRRLSGQSNYQSEDLLEPRRRRTPLELDFQFLQFLHFYGVLLGGGLAGVMVIRNAKIMPQGFAYLEVPCRLAAVLVIMWDAITAIDCIIFCLKNGARMRSWNARQMVSNANLQDEAAKDTLNLVADSLDETAEHGPLATFSIRRYRFSLRFLALCHLIFTLLAAFFEKEVRLIPTGQFQALPALMIYIGALRGEDDVHAAR